MAIKFYIGIVLRVLELCFFLYLIYLGIKGLYLRKQLLVKTEDSLLDKTAKRSLWGNTFLVLFFSYYSVKTIIRIIDFLNK